MSTVFDDPIDMLMGHIIEKINWDHSDGIEFTTKSGRKFLMYHEQDCCESVKIEDIEGRIDEPFEVIFTSEDYDNSGGDRNDSCTITTYTIKYQTTSRKKNILGTMKIIWRGESNGYYSQTPTIRETTNG